MRRNFRPVRVTTTTKGLQSFDYRLQTIDFRLQTLDYRLQTTDYRLQTSDYRLQTTDFRLQTLTYIINGMDCVYLSLSFFTRMSTNAHVPSLLA